jgi:hypothetical protein
MDVDFSKELKVKKGGLCSAPDGHHHTNSVPLPDLPAFLTRPTAEQP